MDTLSEAVANGTATAATRTTKDIVKERFKEDETIEYVSNHQIWRIKAGEGLERSVGQS